MSVLKYGVVAPVAAGVTADPRWMTAFARHLEACGFESVSVVEHAVLATQYDSVYPYDSSGRVELAADCPVPDPLDLLSFWPAIPIGSGWPPGCWCCPTTIRSCWPNERRPLMCCRAAGFGCVSVSAGCGKRSRRAAPTSEVADGAPTNSWPCCGRSGRTDHRASPIMASSFSSRT